MPKKPKRWTHAEGEQGETVTVYERKTGGLLYARAFDPKLRGGRGDYRRVSLKHRDKESAITYALEQAAKLREGKAEVARGRVTLKRLTAEYLIQRSPHKTGDQQTEDKRRAEMWLSVLGAQKEPELISLGEWEAFIQARSSGSFDADGRAAPEEKRRQMRNRTVAADCLWLRQLLNWATKWRDRDNRYLLRENPVRGFPIPREKNPRRPVASTDRYEKLRKVSDQVVMEIRWDSHRKTQRSYLSELLDIAFGTGRRITAICSLRYEDLRLGEGPKGSIRWPADTDKTGHETVTPITVAVRTALDRIIGERPGIGQAYLFPSPKDRSKPVSKDLASYWLKRAEGLAKVDKQDGSLWNAFRRLWVTARKHLPDVDVARAGGWKDLSVLRNSYQRPDDETILAVVEGGRELREKHA